MLQRFVSVKIAKVTLHASRIKDYFENNIVPSKIDIVQHGLLNFFFNGTSAINMFIVK